MVNNDYNYTNPLLASENIYSSNVGRGSNSNKRKYLLVLLLILVVVVLIILFIQLNQPSLKQVAVYRASSTASDIQYPYLESPSTIYYFTGSSFSSYDTKTATTQTISPQFAFPDVSNINWSSTGVVFQASNFTTNDDLYPAILSNQLNPSQEYWWNFNFATQQLRLLLPADPSVQNINQVIWNSNGNSYAMLESNNSVYLSTDPSKSVYNLPAGSKIIQFSGNKFTYIDNDSLIQVDLRNDDSSVITVAAGKITSAYVSSDNRTIAYTIAEANQNGNAEYADDLYKVDPSSHKSKNVLSGFDGVLSGSGGALYAAYTDSNDATHLNLYSASGNGSTFDLGPVLQRDSTIASILPDGSNTIYLDSSRNQLIKASTNPVNSTNPINNEYKIQSDIYLNGFEIHYIPASASYQIDIDSNPYQQYQDSALSYIKSLGIDPNQIDITWRANSGVNWSNPYVVTTPQAGYTTDPTNN